MIKTDHIANNRRVGGDYFELKFLRSSNKKLSEYLTQFSREDYWILKATRHQEMINIEEFLEFKYSCYIFFKKDLYNINEIFEWINWFKDKGGVQFLHKPTPPFSPEKIIVRK